MKLNVTFKNCSKNIKPERLWNNKFAQKIVYFVLFVMITGFTYNRLSSAFYMYFWKICFHKYHLRLHVNTNYTCWNVWINYDIWTRSFWLFSYFICYSVFVVLSKCAKTQSQLRFLMLFAIIINLLNRHLNQTWKFWKEST